MGDRHPQASAPRFHLYSVAVAIALSLTVALGLWTKFGYQGWGKTWVNDSSGGILYEIAWILAIGLVWPRLRSRNIALGVFCVTATIEFSQLIPLPKALVSNLIWRLLIGTTFVWWDFPHYAVGCLIGWLILQQLRQRYLSSNATPDRSPDSTDR
ncbi:MAG: DUF2809 domain-containing protein [Cyanothece sp. SIO2G6]|nr:DUF2809 domain-containing protein [Cyanothece sp. SIO2G6]